MDKLLTDNGPEFVSKDFNDTLDQFGIKHTYTTPYKPSSNGAIERVNRTVGELLRNIGSSSSNWDLELSKVVMVYNQTIHSQLGISPSQFLLTNSHKTVTSPLISTPVKEEWSPGHPKFHPFKLGQLVLKKVVKQGNLVSNKLTPIFDGPYIIKTVHDNGVSYVLLDLDNSQKRAHHTDIKEFKEIPSYLKKHFNLDDSYNFSINRANLPQVTDSLNLETSPTTTKFLNYKNPRIFSSSSSDSESSDSDNNVPKRRVLRSKSKRSSFISKYSSSDLSESESASSTSDSECSIPGYNLRSKALSNQKNKYSDSESSLSYTTSDSSFEESSSSNKSSKKYISSSEVLVLFQILV